jgi:hypothetical protein
VSRSKLLEQNALALLYRLQYQKKIWGNLKKVWQKNVFAQKYDEIRRLDGKYHELDAK